MTDYNQKPYQRTQSPTDRHVIDSRRGARGKAYTFPEETMRGTPRGSHPHRPAIDEHFAIQEGLKDLTEKIAQPVVNDVPVAELLSVPQRSYRSFGISDKEYALLEERTGGDVAYHLDAIIRGSVVLNNETILISAIPEFNVGSSFQPQLAIDSYRRAVIGVANGVQDHQMADIFGIGDFEYESTESLFDRYNPVRQIKNKNLLKQPKIISLEGSQVLEKNGVFVTIPEEPRHSDPNLTKENTSTN